ncbi:hypothetical protein [Mobiluncus curtisii]|uniref:hypothetical protein n=1 Tax=Mobiluncus curtisii TaxID=2051 RepID=UPI00242A83EA|nr:hypothetical protein [Mobiluncus curtisii]
MPATTQNLKLPYPLPTDPIADGANQIKALAESLDTQIKPLKVAMLNKKVNVNGNDNYVEDYIYIDKPEGFTTLLGAYCSYSDVFVDDSGKVIGLREVQNVSIENNKIKIKYTTWKSSTPMDLSILVLGY